MSAGNALDCLADRFGILPEYWDLSGRLQSTSRETKIALLRANGLELSTDRMIQEEWRQWRETDAARRCPYEVIEASHEAFQLDIPENSEWRLQTENSQTIVADGRSHGSISLPPLTAGIHELTVRTGDRDEVIHIIATPGTAPLLFDKTGRAKVWGVNGALYGLHSERTIGLGDYVDLAMAAETLANSGADFFGINPVHNLGWRDTDTISPYSPSHRGFLNTSHIAPDRIFGLEMSAAAQAQVHEFKNSGDFDSHSETVNYARHGDLHRKILRSLYETFTKEATDGVKSRFGAYCEDQGSALQVFANFESQGRGTESDRQAFSSDSKAASESEDFHSWLQWQADLQLSDAQDRATRAGMALGLYMDLAVGPRRDGAEAWCERDSIARNVSLGAPPDHLNPAGQNWGLAGYAPAKLTANKYSAVREILRRAMDRCGLLRIDHALGMNRSYWIPDDGSPGGYIKQPYNAFLAVVAIEADRAETVVVGEDLGLVPDGFREAMNARNIYSYRVLQYEKDSDGAFNNPDQLPAKSLACFGTHDTPTMRGFWQGTDIDWWQKLGWIDDEQAAAAHSQRAGEKENLLMLNRECPLPAALSFDPISSHIHTALAGSPAALVSVQLDDLTGEVAAQNLPGTIDEHPNWRRRCRDSVAQLTGNKNLQDVSRLMAENGRRNQLDGK